jgi:hypothetical protein
LRRTDRAIAVKTSIHESESFEGWAAIGAALAIGKAHALKVTGANAARGQHYSRQPRSRSTLSIRGDG